MALAIQTSDLSYRYGRTMALQNIDLEVEEGSLYALLGPNGAGKTTLMKILLGLLRPTTGHAHLLGRPTPDLGPTDRCRVGYVAEGQSLPAWMTVRQLSRYLAPMYPTWDRKLAEELRQRLRLPNNRPIRKLSRGEAMKAALLVTLAPRPRLLIMDEPFTGMDALVKDEIIQGLLGAIAQGSWTVLVASHDIGELEVLVDWVGFLNSGTLTLSEPADVLRGRFHHVEVVTDFGVLTPLSELPPDWLGVTRSGQRLTFLITDHGSSNWKESIRSRFPAARRIEARPAGLREIFVALSRDDSERA